MLGEKDREPPVLAVAEDGSAVVPLLGGLGGVNRMAREVAVHLEVSAAITTSGELRFGTCLLEPPAGYVLADLEQGKGFVSDLLGGQTVRIEGDAPWLAQAKLPVDNSAARVIHISPHLSEASADKLMIHPQQIAVWVERASTDLLSELQQALHSSNLAAQSLACLLAVPALMAKHRAARRRRAAQATAALYRRRQPTAAAAQPTRQPAPAAGRYAHRRQPTRPPAWPSDGDRPRPRCCRIYGARRAPGAG